MKIIFYSEADPKPELYSVVIGSHSTVKVEMYEKTFNISQLIMHEDYDEDTIANDVALIKLNEPISYSAHVMPVCLDREDVPTGTDCIITGWGTTLSKYNITLLWELYLVSTIAHSLGNYTDFIHYLLA